MLNRFIEKNDGFQIHITGLNAKSRFIYHLRELSRVGTPEHQHAVTASPNPAYLQRKISRRSQLEIRMDIMRAIMEGAEAPTLIMYKANLSWILLCDHLNSMAAQGFLVENSVGQRKKFSLTAKGIEMLGVYLNLVKEFVIDDEVSNGNSAGGNLVVGP
jgi:predicted transcriptional regulator